MIYELRKTTATEIIREMKEFGKHYGYPSKILTDNGTQFTSMKLSFFSFATESNSSGSTNKLPPTGQSY